MRNLLMIMQETGLPGNLASYSRIINMTKATGLIQKVSNGIVTDYEYDAGGNLVKEIEGESVRRFEYDDFKRLVKVINPDGTYMENIYDAEGMRVQTVRKR